MDDSARFRSIRSGTPAKTGTKVRELSFHLPRATRDCVGLGIANSPTSGEVATEARSPCSIETGPPYRHTGRTARRRCQYQRGASPVHDDARVPPKVRKILRSDRFSFPANTEGCQLSTRENSCEL